MAVLLKREDLLATDSPASTRARAAWARGDLTGAIRILETAGLGDGPQARRLRSERRLLEEGYRLRVADVPRHSSDGPGEAPLRVLHLITNSLPHTQSGYSLRTHNILVGLRDHGIESLALTRTGYPVMVGKPWCADEDVVDGIRYRRTLPRRLGSTPEARLDQEVDEALRVIRDFRPHVLHATTDYRNALVAQAVSAATGVPWVFEVRGLMEMTWTASRRDAASQGNADLSEKVERIVAAESSLARDACAVVTLSRTMANVLVDRGVRRDRITLVPNGVEAELLAERLTPAQARARLGDVLPSDALAVGAVSALVDYEGHDVLLRAVALLLADASVPLQLRKALHVVIAGDGVTAPELVELAHQLGIENRLIMPGRVPRGDAKLWVQALDAVIVPRKDYEVTRMVTPQKPAEAMALGRPVIGSDLPALRETLEGVAAGEAGILVPPDDHVSLAGTIAALLADVPERKRLSKRGREVATGRTWEAMMSRYELVYLSIAQRQRDGHPHGE
ncbi:MAG: glycosyltransferase [Microbacterium sp.]